MADGDLIVALAQASTIQHSGPVYDAEKKPLESMVADSLEDDDDSIHEGLPLPTAEEMLTLRRVSDAIPWNAYRELFLYADVAH